MPIRRDNIYLVITIGKRANSYYLRKRVPKLNANQIALKIPVEIDTDQWLDRILPLTAPLRPKPPDLPEPKNLELTIGKTDGELVRDRMAGRV